jgi:hypothetical protein
VVTFDRVRELALALPETEEVISYATPAFKVRGKLFARLREDGTLMVKADLEHQSILIETNPTCYFTTPHYNGYPSVLIRLEHVNDDDLADHLTDAWLRVAPKRLAAEFSRKRAG